MNKYEVVNMGNSNPYPMYFTLKGKDGASFKKQAIGYDGKPIIKEFKPVMDNFTNGTSLITVAHNKILDVGDIIEIQKVEHIIDEIIEKRKPKGKRFEKGVDFYKLNCSYVRFTGQTV